MAWHKQSWAEWNWAVGSCCLCGVLPLKQAPSRQHQPVLLYWPFSPCVEKVKPPQQEFGMYSCWHTHTHPQLQRNASYFWAPKVIQTSSLFLVLPLLDHCSFFCFATELACFWSAGHSLLRCLFRRSTCSLSSEQVHCLSQAYVFFFFSPQPVTAALCRVLR